MNTNLVNATPIDLTFADGRKETITITKLGITKLYRFMKFAAEDQTPALVALCAGKPESWIDTLTVDSFADLARACVELNFTNATAIALKDPVAAARMAPMFQRMAEAMQISLTTLSGTELNASSLAPAPSASAEATGNGSASTPPTGSEPLSAPPAG